MTPDLPLTLYVDRSCPLCAREVRWLERQADPTRLRLVDISAAGFDPAGLGVDLPQLRRRLHARSASGIWLTGVDATYWSWRLAGHGRWAAPLGWRPLRPMLRLAYQAFSLLRPHLDWLLTQTAHSVVRKDVLLRRPSPERGLGTSAERQWLSEASGLVPNEYPAVAFADQTAPTGTSPACRQRNERANRSAGE